MAPSRRRKKKCLLEVHGAGTIVRPAAAANCVQNKLGVVVRNYYLDSGRLQAAPPAFLLFAKAGPRKSLVIPTGHLERAQKILEADGFDVTVQTVRPYPDLSARLWQLLGKGGLDDDAKRLLLRVACWPSGLLSVRGNGGVNRVLVLLCKLFSDLGVLIVTKNKLAASQTVNLLSTQVKGRTCCTWRELELASQPSSVLVLDVQQFAQLAPESKDFPVVVVADAKLASGTAALSSLARLFGSFRFGCLSDCDIYTEWDNFLLEAIFGPPLWRQAADRGPQELFEVVFAEPPHQHAGRRRMDPLERKRELIWHSTARNRFIASIAQAFANRDLAALQRQGLLVDWSPDVFGQLDCSRITVLVEVLEHARQLKKLLPSGRIQSSIEQSTDRSRLPSPDLTITTQSFADQFGPITASVVLRADGTHGQFANYLHRPKGCVRGLLIDLADDFDAEARRAVYCHRDEYRSLGWTSSHPPGQPCLTGPVADVLSKRPAQKGGATM